MAQPSDTYKTGFTIPPLTFTPDWPNGMPAWAQAPRPSIPRMVAKPGLIKGQVLSPAPSSKMPAFKPRKVTGTSYHGQGQIGSVPRTQFYLASSGDYTPDALRKIYQTPTTLATAGALGTDKPSGAQVGGDYDAGLDRLRILENLEPKFGNYIMRHEYGHKFDYTPDESGEMYPQSLTGSFRKAFNAANPYMPYPPGRTDVKEARAAVAAEPWMFKGVSQFYPEFTQQAWNKPGKTPLLNYTMPEFAGTSVLRRLRDAYLMSRARNQLNELSTLASQSGTPVPNK